MYVTCPTLTCLNLQNRQFSVSYTRDIYYGYVNGNNERHLGQSPFHESILQACILSRFLLLTLDGLTVSLYIDTSANQFIMFDSHERNRQGRFTQNGHAVLLSFDTCDEFMNFFFENYLSSSYELTPVHIDTNSNSERFVNRKSDRNNVRNPTFEDQLHGNNVMLDTPSPRLQVCGHKTMNAPSAQLNEFGIKNFDSNEHLFIATPLTMTETEFVRNGPLTEFNDKLTGIHMSAKYPSNHSYSRNIGTSKSRKRTSKEAALSVIGTYSIPELQNTAAENTTYHSENAHTSFQLNNSMLDVGFLCEVQSDQAHYRQSDGNHTYSCSALRPSKVKTRKKKLVSTNISVPDENDSSIPNNVSLLNLNTHNELNVSSLDIGLVCEVNTDYDMNFVDYLSCSNHITGYEQEIRYKPSSACHSCERVLYPNQVRVRRKSNNITQFLNLGSPSDLCTTCYKDIVCNKVPSISYMNNIDPGIVPEELTGLSNLEKRLISKINIFMSIVLLPGGQYAEKGLLLNLPAQTEEIMTKLPLDDPNISHVIISFENPSSTPKQVVTNPVSMVKIRNALLWLQENNPLYADVDISTGPNNRESDVCPQNLFVNDSVEENVLIPVNPAGDCEVHSVLQNRHITLSPNTHNAVDILEKVFGEEMTFPWLYPYGRNGFKVDRPFKLNPSMYFRTRLYNTDPRFRTNITYLLHSAVAYDIACLKSAVNIRMKVTHSSDHGSQPVTIGSLRNANDQSFLTENSYMFMRKIKGTVAYFKNMLYDLLSMFRCLGPPTLFMTLSADDLHWPELGMTLDDLDFKEAFGHSFFMSMRSNPVFTATHFERRFKALMKHVILGESKPLGNVVDYFARVEFQNRGSPHIHMFLWIENIPVLINDTTSSTMVEFINKTVRSTIPDMSQDPELSYLVGKLQTHRHSSYCMKRKSRCRFGFPKKCSEKTKLLINIDVCAKNKGRFYITKRDSASVFVNDYNPVILRHWRANMDIQVIQNAEGAAYYVCAYLCKSEPDDLKNALGTLIHDVFDKQPDIPRSSRLLKIGFCVLKHRRMSAQEAAFRMGSLQLLHASRSFVFVNAWPFCKRMKVLKPFSQLQELPDEDSDIFLHNIVDYYRDRPSCLETYSVFRFASWFMKIPEPKNKVGKYHCPTYNVWFRKRTKFTVVRHTKFAIGSDDYYYSMILLLYPHRTEDELMRGFSSPQLSFEAKSSEFDDGINHLYISLTEEIENAVRRIQMCENEILLNNADEDTAGEEVFDLPSLQLHSNIDHAENRAVTSAALDFEVDCHMHSLVCPMSEKEFNSKLKTLSGCQKTALQILQSCLQEASVPFHLFITGGAGTGKTHVLSMVIAYLNLFHSRQAGLSSVAVCAPTGTAARNIRGLTIHSLLQIPVTRYQEYIPLTEYSLAQLQRKFRVIETLIIDEISMVSDSLLTYISRRLSDIKHNSSPCGGMNVIVVGDFFQLRPVKGRFAFHNRALWGLFRPVFLKRNMRQCDDNRYAELLNRARVGYLRDIDVSSLLTRLNYEEDDVKSVLHIFPLREEVFAFNRRHLDTLAVRRYTLDADHYFSSSDLDPGSSVPDDMIPTDDRDAGGLHKQLELCVGARVMLIRNILTPEGLVNGAMGIVHSFTFDDNNFVLSVNIVFDDHTIGRTLALQGRNEIGIERVQHSYIMCGRTIIRSQFPLTLCWACTIHKVQGLSLDKICVDLGSSVFEKGMSYVALSRVRTLSGLYLLRLNPSLILPPTVVLEEYDRLRRVT